MLKKSLLLLCCSFVVLGCDTTDQTTPISTVAINKILDLHNLPYQRLQFDNGYVYETGGIRGLLIYRKNVSTYYVYDRACPYRLQNSCETIAVDGSGFFVADPCCNSQFDWEGQPQAGVARTNLIRYRSSLSGSLLYITN